MALAEHEAAFKKRLKRFETDFLAYHGNPQLGRYERWYRLEGLLSQTWQSWCQFCRAVLVDSCLGTVAVNGRVIARAQASWTNEFRVGYEAVCAVRGNAPKLGHQNSSLRQEIMWGDVTKLVTVIGILAPANRAELLSGFGVGLAGPQHLQTVRNASAHLNRENAAEIRRLMAFYFGPSLYHPADLAVWTEINSKNPAFISWVSDMRTMASNCVL